MSISLSGHEFRPYAGIEEIKNRAGVFFVCYSGSSRGSILEVGHSRTLQLDISKWQGSHYMLSSVVVFFVHYTPTASSEQRLQIARKTFSEMWMLMPRSKRAKWHWDAGSFEALGNDII